MVEDSFQLKNPNYGIDILAELNNLRMDATFTDMVLCADDGKEFPCHRNVLAVSSPYFKAMFSNDLRESRQGRIVINEISSASLGSIINYAYTGNLEVTVDNAQDMLAAGGLFQYPLIIDACCQFLSKHLHPTNSLGIEHFAHLHCCYKLEADAHQYTLENFSSVVECEEFLQVPVERLQTYLASDLIDVRNEEIVFEAAICWVGSDVSERLPHLCAILEHIRLATIDVSYLEQVVQRHSHISNCDICLRRVEEAKRYHESKTEEHGQRRRSMQTDTPRPSTMAREMLVVLGGMKLNYVLISCEMYDPLKDKWLPLPDMPQPVSWFSATVLNNDIYVTGGILDGHIVPHVLCFQSAKRRWTTVSPMLRPRARHASAVWNGCLYVMGGINLVVNTQLRAVESIERYNPTTDTWTEIGQSPLPRKQSHLQAFNNTLVEVGGTKGGVAEDTLECYICSDAGVLYSGEQFKLPDCIQFGQIMMLNNVFYIMWEDTKKLISLNPERRTFRRLCDLHSTHIHSGAAVLGDKLFISGGLVDSKSSRSVECYDPNTDTWKHVKHMRHPRACHGCVTIKIS